MTLLSQAHRRVFGRRIRVLADQLARRLPPQASVLDVGCGDGSLAALLIAMRPDVSIHGVDVLVRENTAIEVAEFDGLTLPFPDRSFDVLLFVDVLHHAAEPLRLLSEAARVSRGLVLIKDHLADAVGARTRLRFMDWVGNARHGVRLPYTYWTRGEWQRMFAVAGLDVGAWNERIPLYPFPLSAVFGGSLHMVATLEPRKPAAAANASEGRV